MFGTRVVLQKRLSITRPGVPLPLPRPPKKKTSTSYPKTSPHQISHHQCADPRIDSLGSPHPCVQVQRTPAQGSTPKTRKRPRADAVKNTHLKPSCHRTGTTTVPRPNRNVTCVIRGSRSWSHQEPHPSKQAGANIPPPSAIRPCARVMGQGYPLTGPSPGVDHPIYPSSLTLSYGNKVSNIFPKNHGFFFLL